LASTQQLADALSDVFDSGWLTNDGKCVHQLEQLICERLCVRNCVAVANGTLGLELAATSLMSKHGEVIVPSFTFIATAHALSWLGYTPVFAEVDNMTHVLSPADVEAHITSRTVGILGVHLWGTPCAVRPLTEIAKKYSIPLFFDAAHAFLCADAYIPIGNFGACEVFSFHATKFFNTVEGGAITTDDDTLAQRLREMRNFGFPGTGVTYVQRGGINAKLSEVHAAIGIENWSILNNVILRNMGNYARYQRNLNGCGGISVYEHSGNRNYQYVVITLTDKNTSADVLARMLKAENVLARRYFSPPCHLQEPYRYVPRSGTLKNTEALSKQTLVLPTGLAVDGADVDQISELILYYLYHTEEVDEYLRRNDAGSN
jgi:dTDP-4-amino-4,6-dideoxygalactose transaminase